MTLAPDRAAEPAPLRPVSIVVPAHNEVDVIDRCLRSLPRAAGELHLDVVVVCNGCTDETAQRASMYEGVNVIELGVASKAAALNAGDSAARYFPRFYVDADTEMGASAIERVSEVLRSGTALCAAPTPVFNTTDRPFWVRAFYETWTSLPYLNESPVGNGVYALSAEGRRRFESFPDVVADDLFVGQLFQYPERVTVADVTFTIHTPRRIKGLLSMRVRVHRGNRELRTRYPATSPARGGSVRPLLKLLVRPSTGLKAGVYVAVNVVARILAQWRIWRGATTWERDDSARRDAIAP